MSIKHKSNCESCNDSLEEIGQPVHIDGGRSGDTDHTFYQCRECGALWVRVKDSGGLGGNGTFYHSLTDRFF